MFGLSKVEQITDTDKIENLLTKGVEHIFPNTDFLRAKLLKGERVSLYLGIDPTGPTLHLGHVIPLKKLGEFQKLGHKIILLMGDFTAMIGDPTDKKAPRKQLTREEVMQNLKEYRKQSSRFISFDGPNKAEFKFNSTWLSKLSFGEVIELSSHFTVQQMLERDMFAERMKENKPIFVHEFMYPLMQGYDSVAMDVDGEVGGNDQTWNMLAGRDLVKIKNKKEKFVLSTKLLTDSTGKKMGKTENNIVSLNQTPNDMFGKVMSWTDELIVPGFEVATDIPLSEIEKIKQDLAEGKNPRDLKVRLAEEIVSVCVGKKEALVAKEHFENTFKEGNIPQEIKEVTVSKENSLMEVLVKEGIVSSNTECRRLLSEGAITHMDSDKKIGDSGLLQSGVYKIGKKRFLKINIQ